MHCGGHQKGKTSPQMGNCFADETVTQGWPTDLYGNLVQNVSKALNENNYWIYTQLPPFNESSNWPLTGVLVESNCTKRW